MFAIEALARLKGLTVQPFKGGPDYIDSGYHHIASERKCRNLDLFLLSPEFVKQSFAKNSQNADLALIEGMMGLFDGKNAEGEGSSAEIAKLLKIPVVLIVDGSGLAGSAAAIVLGFQTMDPQIRLAGVIFNRVNHDNHYQYLKRAVESKTSVPCLGFLPNEKSIEIPERHLGLTTARENEATAEKILKTANLFQTHFDWETFLKVTNLTRYHEELFDRHPERSEGSQGKLRDEESNMQILCSAKQPFRIAQNDKGLKTPVFRIGVARDHAFSFYYEDNFDLLEETGAELCFFSPLSDQKLPEDLDMLYFGGGFPELHVKHLSANQAMIESVRAYYHAGGKIYAECGGLMFLAEFFCDAEGRKHVLTGIVPGKIHMTERLQKFGYKELETMNDTFLFPKGKKIRSHEFHYSVWDGEGKYTPAYRIGDRTEGFATDRLIASYQHLHFGSDPVILEYLKKNLTK